MPVSHHHHLGQLPQPAERSVIFVANLQSIFFNQQEKTQLLADMVHGIDSYGGRLVSIVPFLFPGNQNLLVLERRPSPELMAWFSDVLNLRIPEIRVLTHAAYCDASHPDTLALIAELKTHGAPWVDGYVTDARLVELASETGKQTRSSDAASLSGNNKLLLHRYLAAHDLPLFESVEADNESDVAAALRQLRRSGYRYACLKSAVGASGIGLSKLPTDEPPPSLPGFYFDEWPCLVQGWEDECRPGISAVESPSVQLWLDDEAVTAFDLTSQILSADSIHEGNSAPPDWGNVHDEVVAELLAQADAASGWLHDLGYRGAASIDFHLAWPEAGRLPVVRICEINARVTGATYPAVLARHFLPNGAWRMQNLHFPCPLPARDLLSAIHKTGKAFQPGKETGLVPVNVNLTPDGQVQKCQMLALGKDLDSCAVSMSALEATLPVEYIHDRD